MIPYKFLTLTDKTPNRGYWDQELLEDIFKDSRFVDGTNINIPTVNGLTLHEYGAVIVVPGAGNKNEVKQLNKELALYKWVILIVTSDEEGQFPVEYIKHPNIRIYVQYPKQPRHDLYTKWPLGYTPHTRRNIVLSEKDLDWVFAGQVTHPRREAMAKKLEEMIDRGSNGILAKSKGFTLGEKPDDYIQLLNRAKVVPAPSGPISADSFRLYEALEAGAVPIGDNISPAGDKDFWEYLIGPVPFPTINYYHDLPGYIADTLEKFPEKANKVQAWYLKWKHQLKEQLIRDVEELSGQKLAKPITVVIPVSPIKSHPSTEILEKCVGTIKSHLPNAEMIITFDGVRSEHESRRADYEEFTRQALYLCNMEWDAIPVLFDEHTHQVGMLRAVIDEIKSPMILYVESDTGLTPDREIDWEYCMEKIMDGTSNMIRFHYQGHMDKEHEHLMFNHKGKLLETIQWSQRPHLASTAYYRRILTTYFSPDAKSFIEDVMHGVVQKEYQENGKSGWFQHRLHIYYPDDGYLKRSDHFDGREGEDKLDGDQVF